MRFSRVAILVSTTCVSLIAQESRAPSSAWLANYLGPGGVQEPRLPSQARAEITEFLMPEPNDLPHDIAIERSANPRAIELDSLG